MTIAATWLAPLHISPDGYLYLQSSKYVFGPDAATSYAWIREPLYPLILKAERFLLGTSDRALIFVQAGALVLSAQLACSAFLRRWRRLQSIGVILIVFNPVSLMYIGSVLQTTWVTLSVAGFAWLVTRCWIYPLKHRYLLVGGLALWTIFSAYLSFQLGYLGLAAGVGAGAGIANAQLNAGQHVRRFTARRIGVLASAACVGGILLTLVGVVGLAPWTQYKQATILNAYSSADDAVAARGIPVSYSGSPSSILATALVDPTSTINATIERSISLVSARDGAVDENRIYTDVMVNWPCGALEEALMIQSAHDEALTLINSNCRAPLAMNIFSTLREPGYALITLAGWAFLIGIICLPLLRRWGSWFAILPGLQLIVMYAITGLNFTRYGYPVYPLGVAVLLLFAVTIWSGVRTRWRAHKRSRMISRITPLSD